MAAPERDCFEPEDTDSNNSRMDLRKRVFGVLAVSITLPLSYIAFMTSGQAKVAKSELERAQDVEARTSQALDELLVKSLRHDTLRQRNFRQTLELKAAIDSFSSEEFREPFRSAVEKAQLSQAFLRTASVQDGHEAWICLPEEGHRLRIDFSVSKSLVNYLDPAIASSGSLSERFEFSLEAGKAYHVSLNGEGNTRDETTKLSLEIDGKQLSERSVLLRIARKGEYSFMGNALRIPRVASEDFPDAVNKGKWLELASLSYTFDKEEKKYAKFNMSLYSDKAIYAQPSYSNLLDAYNIDFSVEKDDSPYRGMLRLRGLKPQSQNTNELQDADTQLEPTKAREESPAAP